MKELIERIEGAEGPSYALDCEIARAINPQATSQTVPPAYTASLDAAMTLAPESRQVDVLLDAINYNTHEIDWLKHLPRYVAAAALKARGE